MSSSVLEALVQYKEKLLAMPGVVGVGRGHGEQQAGELVVMLARASAATETKIRQLLHDVPVRFIVTGRFKAARTRKPASLVEA